MNIALQRIQLLLVKTNTKPSKMIKDIGIPSSTYSSWFTKDRYPSTEYVIKLAKYFGVTTDYLLGAPARECSSTLHATSRPKICSRCSTSSRSRTKRKAEKSKTGYDINRHNR
nr:helix-turn-helix transcriptional regulator [Clostridia bacterium]